MAKRLLSLLVGAALLSGCAMAASPVQGGWYTDVKWGMQVPGGAPGPKSGTAEATSILGLIATGDASIEAAAKNGGITTVRTVDHHAMSVLGIFAKFTTKVTGD